MTANNRHYLTEYSTVRCLADDILDAPIAGATNSRHNKAMMVLCRSPELWSMLTLPFYAEWILLL